MEQFSREPWEFLKQRLENDDNRNTQTFIISCIDIYPKISKDFHGH